MGTMDKVNKALNNYTGYVDEDGLIIAASIGANSNIDNVDEEDFSQALLVELQSNDTSDTNEYLVDFKQVFDQYIGQKTGSFYLLNIPVPQIQNITQAILDHNAVVGAMWDSLVSIKDITDSSNSIVNDPSNRNKNKNKNIDRKRFAGEILGSNWALDKLNSLTAATEDGDMSFVNNGQGVYMFILDTAIHADYFESNRLLLQYSADYANPLSPIFGGNSAVTTNSNVLHGTQSALAAAGSGNTGVASEAFIIPIKIFNNDGTGLISAIVFAIQHAADVKSREGFEKAVINMSAGYSSQVTPSLNDPVARAASDAIFNQNIPVVQAAGNDGEDACLYGLKYSDVVSVGALSRSGSIASFSNTGECVDIYAPGASVPTVAGNSRFISGTSFAAPYVAGAVAVLMNEYNVVGFDAQLLLYRFGLEKIQLSTQANINVASDIDRLTLIPAAGSNWNISALPSVDAVIPRSGNGSIDMAGNVNVHLSIVLTAVSLFVAVYI